MSSNPNASDELTPPEGPHSEAHEWDAVTDLPVWPSRAQESHKGTYGRVLVVAGSVGMSGAACLAGLAALRAGAGLVTVACPTEIVPIVAGFEPCYTILPLPSDKSGKIGPWATEKIRQTPFNALLIGPGLGKSETLHELVRDLVKSVDAPMVLDADALNLIARDLDALADRDHPTVLTPHPGEFARLAQVSTEIVQHDRARQASILARRTGAVVVLKGWKTVITDGHRLTVNPTGNAGMATGGTGDVLAGLLVGLLAQDQLDAFETAQLATYLHGMAGDHVAEVGSEQSLIARDLLDALPAAWHRFERRRHR